MPKIKKIGYYGNITFWTERKEYVFDALDVLPIHYIIKGSEHGRMYSVVKQTLENIREKTLTIKNKDYFTELNSGILNTSKARTNT